ncbi:MAG: hypothetical protein ACYSWU_14800 [Planctomycetota bacterium]|jgi:hypothetical protein
MRFRWLLLGAAILAAWAMAAGAGELAAPVRVMADGKPLDVGGIGYAAPFMSDLDGDGVRDLWVGEFSQGRLRVYRNLGTNSKPRFGEYEWFKDGAETGRVPAG